MQGELIVLSHLRWAWVWQRPQHLVSRLGRGRRTWFVEEPWPGDVSGPRLGTSVEDGVTRVWLDVPDPGFHVGFDAGHVAAYCQQLPGLVGPGAGDRVVWLYTPLALEAALALEPTVLVYDVMDDLASFKDASPSLVAAQEATLRAADVVFAGGPSLHRSVLQRGRHDAHRFPSGVEPEHYERARSFDVRGDRPVAGYVGVIDERIDLDLVAGVAAALPDWEVRMVGPVAKIDPATLPRAENITYTGPKPYSRLPAVMAGFDVALMPFASNEATRSISPTKTLEYLAAGLPVVSTPVPDVVTQFSAVVDVQDEPLGFADACRGVHRHDRPRRDDRVRPLLYEHHWDTITDRMAAILARASVQPRNQEMPA